MRALAVVLSLAITACSGAATPSSTPTGAATRSPDATATRYGVAGLIPPHFPSTAAADHEAMYTSFAATGGAVGVYTAWADSPATEGKVPAVIPSSIAAAAKYKFGPLVIALGVAQDAPGGGVRSTVDWAAAQRERFLQMVTAVARDHRPEYLALGVESNRLWVSDPAAFDGFVKGYADAYAAIKAASPATKVFTIFQLELMRGTAFLMTAKPTTATQWELLDRFAGRLDLVGFTTYPFLAFASPTDLPADYYADVARRAAAPLAFTEIGWPSADLGGAATGSPYGGTPEEQAAFVARFFALVGAVKPALALWSFPFDLGDAMAPTFRSVALRTRDGAAKPALAAWQAGTGSR